MLAKATKTPEWSLTEDESKTMASRVTAVMQHYNIKASQKAIDWGNLLLTGGLMYGGKIHAVNERHKAERAAKKENANAIARPFGLA